MFPAWSAPMAAQATVDTATEERHFLRSSCLALIDRRIIVYSVVEYSRVERAGWWVSELVIGLLRFSRCELVLLETGSRRIETFREPRGRVMSAVRSRYQATTSKDTAHWKELVRAAVNWRLCELTIELLVVTICKLSINPTTNSIPVCSHSYTRLYHTSCGMFKLRKLL
jgi:hypothetical protein